MDNRRKHEYLIDIVRMTSVFRKTQQIAEDYVKKISNQIPAKKAILFSSYAKRTLDKDSDIYIAIF